MSLRDDFIQFKLGQCCRNGGEEGEFKLSI